MPYNDLTNLAILKAPSRFRKTREFENVVANSVANLNLPVKGPYYRSLTIRVEDASVVSEASLLGVVTGFRIKLNGSIIQEWALEDFFAEQKRLGATITASGGVGFIHIPFIDKSMRLPNAEAALGIGTIGLDTMSVELDIGAIAPTVKLWASEATILGPEAPGPGQFIQTTIQRQGALVAGVNDITNLVEQRGDIFRLIFKEGTPGSITNIRLEFENALVVDVPVNVLHEIMRQDGVRVPQSGYVVLDPVYLGYAVHALGIGNTGFHKLELTLSGGSTVDIIMLTIDERF